MFSSSKNKTKILSILSSIALWIYVTNVVDPTESRTYKDIPITINNLNAIQENSLNIFPEKNLTADINIRTNLSKLKKISRDNLAIYGNITNPRPGKNILTLTSNLPDYIQNDIHADDLIINLEFYETLDKDISIIANKKYTTDDYIIDIDNRTVQISGTKTILNKIDKVVATIKGNDVDEDFIEKLELIPLDINGNKVEDVKLSNKYITATITKNIVEDSANKDNLDTKSKSINNIKDTKDKKTQEIH